MVPTMIAGLPSPCTGKALYYVLENKGDMPPTHSVYQPQGPKREKVERGKVLRSGSGDLEIMVYLWRLAEKGGSFINSSC